MPETTAKTILSESRLLPALALLNELVDMHTQQLDYALHIRRETNPRRLPAHLMRGYVLPLLGNWRAGKFHRAFFRATFCRLALGYDAWAIRSQRRAAAEGIRPLHSPDEVRDLLGVQEHAYEDLGDLSVG